MNAFFMVMNKQVAIFRRKITNKISYTQIKNDIETILKCFET